MRSLSPVMNVMVSAVRKAGRGLVRDFGEVENLQVSLKGTADFVSSADTDAEERLTAVLKKSRPGYGFLREESGEESGDNSRFRWVIDPLDGTTNFLHGLPHFSISVGLQENDEIIAGVVYAPVLNELFYAEKGSGAFQATPQGDRRLRVSARKSLKDSVICTGIPHRGRPQQERFLEQLPKIMQTVAGVRRTGSAALDLAYVAAGRFDGFWEFALKPWDMTAGMLLVQEAGGYISGLFGERRRSEILDSGHIMASNDGIHASLLDLLT